MIIDPSQTGTTVLPCRGEPHGVGWLRVALPLPLEVDRGGDGSYVLDDAGSELGATTGYVWAPYRL